MLKKIIGLVFLLPSLVMASQFIEGKEFQIISNPKPLETPNKGPVVTEFFSYGCPACYNIEPSFKNWTNAIGKAVRIERVPVVFKPEWELYAKAYYTAKVLALSGKMDPLMFKAIQVDKRSLTTKQSLIDFFVSQGLDREIAKSAFENSPTIDMKVSNGMALMAQYQISGVPAFIVNNKYKTDIQMAGSPKRLFEILDYLVRKG